MFILTYLFDGQSLHHFLEMYDIPYEFIGVERSPAGEYRFSASTEYVPEYVRSLREKLVIVDDQKLNEIGESEFALSLSWFDKDSSDLSRLKNNLYNFFRYVCGADAAEKMWATYKDARCKIQGKGYTKGFIPFNQKATNEYRDRTAVAYCVNLYMNVGQKLFYQNNGVNVDEDAYALSIMVQWIWRSAIRDGNKIWLYVPSKRMRGLLTAWMEEVSGRA